MVTSHETSARSRATGSRSGGLLVLLIAAIASVVFGVGAVRLAVACSDQSCDVAAGAGGMALPGFVAGAVVVVVGVAVARLRGRALAARRLLLVVASAALFAGAPDQAAWGACQTQSGWTWFGVGVVASTIDVDDPHLTFTHTQSLMGCF